MAWGLFTFMILLYYISFIYHDLLQPFWFSFIEVKTGLAFIEVKRFSDSAFRWEREIFVLRHPLPNFRRPWGSKRCKSFVGRTWNGQDKRSGSEVDPRAAAQQAKILLVVPGRIRCFCWKEPNRQEACFLLNDVKCHLIPVQAVAQAQAQVGGCFLRKGFLLLTMVVSFPGAAAGPGPASCTSSGSAGDEKWKNLTSKNSVAYQFLTDIWIQHDSSSYHFISEDQPISAEIPFLCRPQAAALARQRALLAGGVTFGRFAECANITCESPDPTLASAIGSSGYDYMRLQQVWLEKKIECAEWGKKGGRNFSMPEFLVTLDQPL